MRKLGLYGSMAVAVFLVGCAAPVTQRADVSNAATRAEAEKQMEFAAQEITDEELRLYRVYWEVSTKGVELCPKTQFASGVWSAVAKDKTDLDRAMTRLYGLGALPKVLGVVAGSPADLAGVRVGDELVSIFGVPATEAKEVIKRMRDSAEAVMPVQVRRAGQELTLDVHRVRACGYPVVLRLDHALNAYADGQKIYVTRGMMEFAHSDEELALVVGHELAHNAMGHLDSKKANAAGGLLADIALAVLTRGAYNQASISNAAGQAFSQEFESEADYVGLYMMAHTIYSIQDAPRFWRRMAAASPSNIKGSMSASHPSTPYRMLALEAAVKEIDNKRTAGQPLLPERKDGKPFVPGQH